MGRDDMQVNVAGLRRNIKNLAHNYSDAQVKVREATSNDPWGPSSTLMAEIADLTYNVMAFTEIMQMIWKRLNDHGKNWRHVYKALVLMEYLIKTGSEKVAMQCKENIFAIHTLKDFQYMEEGKDQGLNVREKAKQLCNLLKDEERLKNERARALKAKQRFAQSASAFGSDGALDTPTSPTYPASIEAVSERLRVRWRFRHTHQPDISCGKYLLSHLAAKERASESIEAVSERLRVRWRFRHTHQPDISCGKYLLSHLAAKERASESIEAVSERLRVRWRFRHTHQPDISCGKYLLSHLAAKERVSESIEAVSERLRVRWRFRHTHQPDISCGKYLLSHLASKERASEIIGAVSERLRVRWRFRHTHQPNIYCGKYHVF
ncbi:hypothetical protein O0L34_g8445 [Tuta absoluta]|nr:hypothetical protein O0L34_g8445 [Tuta absoluta]